MSIEATYLGMPVEITELDQENLAYFQHCADHDYHLQSCNECDLLRYPPTAACPWCSCLESSWKPVEGKGVIYSYEEVAHAIQPAFKQHLPYLVLLVELDTQRDHPAEHESLRIVANLTDANGDLTTPELVKQVGIGTRVKMVFKDVADGISMPHFTIDEDAKQPDKPWRYIYE